MLIRFRCSKCLYPDFSETPNTYREWGVGSSGKIKPLLDAYCSIAPNAGMGFTQSLGKYQVLRLLSYVAMTQIGSPCVSPGVMFLGILLLYIAAFEFMFLFTWVVYPSILSRTYPLVTKKLGFEMAF